MLIFSILNILSRHYIGDGTSIKLGGGFQQRTSSYQQDSIDCYIRRKLCNQFIIDDSIVVFTEKFSWYVRVRKYQVMIKLLLVNL